MLINMQLEELNEICKKLDISCSSQKDSLNESNYIFLRKKINDDLK